MCIWDGAELQCVMGWSLSSCVLRVAAVSGRAVAVGAIDGMQWASRSQTFSSVTVTCAREMPGLSFC